MKLYRILLPSWFALACGTPETATTGLAPARLADAHGVVVAGGETFDFGTDTTTAPTSCTFGEPVRLAADAARSTWPDLAEDFATLDKQAHAPLYWGTLSVCDGPLPEHADTEMTALVEVLSVERYPGLPKPDAEVGVVCNDLVQYDTVVDLSTEDQGLAGRFYARFDRAYPGGVRTQVMADARNFRGSLSFPIEPERPHHAALRIDLQLDGETFLGNLDVAVNYTDDDPEADDVVGEGAAECSTGRYGGLGAAGFWLTEANEDLWSPAVCESHPACVTNQVTLNDYAGSKVDPTCRVDVRAYVSDDAGNIVDQTVRKLYIDGELVSPEQTYWPVPNPLGRFAVGTQLVLEVTSASDNGHPYAGIELVGGTSATDSCDEPGCTARAELVVVGYCGI